MAALMPIYTASPIWLVVAGALVALIFLATIRLPPAMRARSLFFIALGLVAIALAAGHPIWLHHATGEVTVMVDLSPSTRGASWRNRGSLDRRIIQILGSTPYHLIAFAESNQALPAIDLLPDISADRTVFSPPAADAILLFSDGRFDLPAFAPQTFPVIDPAMDEPIDASVEELEFRDRQVVATLHNNGSPRTLTWSGATPETTDPVTASVIRTAKPSVGSIVRASLSAGDLWSENDSLSIQPPPPQRLEKWWVGDRNPGLDWRQLRPNELPTDNATYLNAAVVVLDNVSADALSSEQFDRLAQYCRDLGGSLLLLGGDHAFAAGDYIGTTLDSISPLASSPPMPAAHWVLLIDGSGSMDTDTDAGGTRWQIEIAAITRLLPALPPDDLVSIGSFAENLNWWFGKKIASETVGLSLPPSNVSPHGPTNLQPALESVIQSTGDGMPTELLLLTDAEAEVSDLNSLAHRMGDKKIRLHLLAIGKGNALPALQSLTTLTGGSTIQQFDPHQWIGGARQLLRSALPDRLSHDPIDVQFTGNLTRAVKLWNRTWLKPTATTLASAKLVPMAARWQVGEGQVAAVAYSADITDAKRIADLIATPPRDPRFTMRWIERSNLHVSVDAIDRGSYLNDEQIRLEISGPIPSVNVIPQTGPGRYEVDVAAPPSPTIATVRVGNHVLERFAIAGRYAPEFDKIGNDYANLKALAERTGGSVIEPGSAKSIDFNWPVKEISLVPWLAGAGALLIAAGLLDWRRNS